jgi:hydrogenase maturation protease
MRVLVAGIGNIFFGDDGFGCEAARVLAREPHAPGVKIEDFGIRGLHLAYELLAGYDRAILIDAAPRGGAPGTLYAIEPDVDLAGVAPDAHRMDVHNVLAFLRMLDGEAPPMTIVGCEPATVEPGIGLSAAVTRAVAPAAALVRRLLADDPAALASQPSGDIA